MAQITEVVKIRRKVLSEIARLTFSDELDKHNIVDVLDNLVHESGPRYRCCVHKERAIVKDRVKFVMAQSSDIGVTDAAKNALNGHIADMPIINIMPEACDQCPIDTFFVTNACRNCIAHNCIASCPKRAITVVQSQAYIDKTVCVECGLCKKSCMYGAIVEITRPCERACDIGAIKADKERRAVINYDKCVQCGGCKMACPFGAITEQSFTVQLIQKMKAGKHVYAILAPAFIGQFGIKVKPSQVIGGLKKIGFYDVQEVSFGADIVTLEEAREFAETVPNKLAFMTTSCCPAFVDMVNKHLPELKNHVSTTVSPMVASARRIKLDDPDAVVVFIGPCLAKKVEAKQYPESIDFVFSFEEMESLFVGANINLLDIPETEYVTTASRDGNAFARAGGVVQAVIDAATKINPDLVVKSHRAEGLQNCKMALMQMKAGKIDANFFEGMACTGGCVGGPGTLIDIRISNKLVDDFATSSIMADASDNQKALDECKKHLHWHTK